MMPLAFNTPLLATNIAYGFFFILTISFGIAVYLKSSRQSAHRSFLLLSIAVGLFQISHILGVNNPDPIASRDILSSDLAVFFVVCFVVHWMLAAIGKEKVRSKVIVFFYLASASLSAFFLLRPDLFLLPSVPKLYFPNYYEAGPLYWILPAYFFLSFLYILFELFLSYKTADPSQKKLIKYYLITIAIGMPLGGTAFFLVMDIPVDPIFSGFLSLYVIPLGIGILRRDAMEIKIIAKRALVYGLAVVGVGLFISGTVAATGSIDTLYPWMPMWGLPLAAALVSVFIGGLIWEKTSEVELLKYEFVTIVTHKFRTPLTRIKWASEILRKKRLGDIDPDAKVALEEIDNAAELLVELTDALVEVKQADNLRYFYSFKPTDVCALVDKAEKSIATLIGDRQIDFSLACPKDPIFAAVDARRMQFAIQTILENAVTYTPPGGKVSVKVSQEGNNVAIETTDTGIGIAPEDIQRIFNKFFRSKEAKTADTEGMGIGLFMARQIVDRHRGKMLVRSKGTGKGSVFTILLPVSSPEARS